MKKIKPCPFCGEEAEIKYSDRYYWIECEGCHARTNDFCIDDYERGMAETQKLTTKSWNKREMSELQKYIKLRILEIALNSVGHKGYVSDTISTMANCVEGWFKDFEAK